MDSLPLSLLKGAVVGVLLVLLMFAFSSKMSSKTFGENSLWDNVTDEFKEFFSFAKPEENLEQGKWENLESDFIFTKDVYDLEKMFNRLKDCNAIGKAQARIGKNKNERVNCSKFCSKVGGKPLRRLIYDYREKKTRAPIRNLPAYLLPSESINEDLQENNTYQIYTHTHKEPVEIEKLKEVESCDKWLNKED